MKKILTLIILAIAVFGVYAFTNKEQVNTEIQERDLLLTKEASWGPCMELETCSERIEVYKTGKIIVQVGDDEYLKNQKPTKETVGKSTFQLDMDSVEKLENVIKETGIMNKECSGELVPDYMATYTFYEDDKEKVVTFPGCEAELETIDKALEDIMPKA